MILDAYIEKSKAELDAFAEKWKAENAKNPDSWPMEMNQGEWNQQELSERF